MSIVPGFSDKPPKYQASFKEHPERTIAPKVLQLIQAHLQMGAGEKAVEVRRDGYYEEKRGGKWIKSSDPSKTRIARQIWQSAVGDPKSNLVITIQRALPQTPRPVPKSAPKKLKYQASFKDHPDLKIDAKVVKLIQDVFKTSQEEAVEFRKEGYYERKQGKWVQSSDLSKNRVAQRIWKQAVKDPNSRLVIAIERAPLQTPRLPPPTPRLPSPTPRLPPPTPRLPSRMVPTHLPPISDQLLAFIHGDSFVESSGYEGGNTIANMQFLVEYLRSIQVPGGEEIIKMLEESIQRENSYRISPPIPDQPAESIALFQEEAGRYADALAEKARGLKRGERFLMEGGWDNLGGGHAMLYMIERIGQKEYAFTLINTGSGIKEHTSKLRGHKTKYQPIIRLRGLTPAQISDPALFASLLKLRCPIDAQGKSAQHSAEEIYQGILPSLGGIRDREYEEQTDLITAQKSGSCSWKVLTKLLQVNMQDRALYKAFIFHLKKASLESYFQNNFQQAGLIDREIELFRRSAEGFARFALRHFTEGIISEQELAEARGLTEQILHAIQRRREGMPGMRGEALLRGSVPESSETRSSLPTHPTMPSSKDARTERGLLGPLQHVVEPPETFEELSDLIFESREFAEQLVKEGNHRGVLQVIQALIKIIPLGALQEGGYLERLSREVDKQEVEGMMEDLAKCSQLLFSSIAGLYESSRGSPEQMGMLCILVAINERLAHLVGDHWLVHTPEIFRAWGENPFAIIYDEKLNQLLQESIPFLIDRAHETGSDFFYQRLSFSFTQDGSFHLSYNPSIKKLKKLIYTLVEEDPNFQHLRGETDRKIFEQVFPKICERECSTTFRTLFAQSLLLSYLALNPHLKKSRTMEGVAVGEVLLIPDSSDSMQLSYKVMITGVSRNALGEREADKEGALFFEDAHTPISHRGFKAILSTLSQDFMRNQHATKTVNQWVDTPYRASYAEPVAGLSGCATREIAFMLSKKATFIPHFLSYCAEHPAALADREFQLLIHPFFYGMNTVEESLKSFPDTGRQLMQFLIEQLEVYKAVNDLPTRLYLLELLMKLSQLGLIPHKTLQKELFTLAKQMEDHTVEGKRFKALVYAQFIASYSQQKEFTAKEAIILSVAYLYVQTYGYDERLSYPHIKEQMEGVIDRVAHSEHLGEEKVARAIVERASQTVLGLPPGDWHGSFPLFQRVDSPFRIDLSTFSIFEGDLPLGGIPSQIANHPSFIHLFSRAHYRVREIHPGVYGLRVGEESYRLFQDEETHQVIIQKWVENRWATYLSHDTVRAFTPEGLIEGCDHWLLPTIEDQFDILIEKRGSKEAVARMRGDADGIEEYASIPEGLALYKVKDRALSAFEEEGFCLNWGDQLLEFPRKKIHFRRGVEGKFFFSENRTFYLSPRQSPPSTLPLFQGALQMEDEEGNKSFLFPREPIDLSNRPRGALHRGSQIDHVKRDGRYFQIAEREGVLTGSTPQENLFLAYLHLGDKNYQEAYRLLDLYLTAQPKGYSHDEIEILEWIFQMIDQMQDPSPHSCAIQLQLLYLANRYLPDELKEKEPFHLDNRLDFTLSRYYPMAHHIQTLAPSPQQELELLEASVRSHPTIPGAHARYLYLQGVVVEEEIALPLPTTPPVFPLIELKHPPTVAEQIPLPEAPIPFPEAVAEVLGSALQPREDENPVVRKESTRVGASVEAYTQEQRGVKRYLFSLKDLQKIAYCAAAKENDREALRVLHQEILVIANKESLNPVDQLVDAMRRLGEQKKELSLDELLIFYLQDNAAAVKERNPHLTEEDLLELTRFLHQYLLIATEVTYLEQVDRAIEDLRGAEGVEREEKELRLDALLRAKRAYSDPTQERIFLIFEYYGEMRLRKEQVELIAKMRGARGEDLHNLIAELIMGSGKSKVIMPLLAFLLSDGEKIPCIIVPDMLYDTNLEDARALSGELLRQSPYTIEIPQGGHLSLEELDRILLKIRRMQGERGYFLLKDSTVKELILDFKETCTALGAIPALERPSDALIDRYRKLQEILNRLLQTALFDEADILFDHLKEMNFSSGAWLKLSEETQDSMENIFLAIAGEEELARFFQLEEESDAPFDRALYEARIKPALAEILLRTADLGAMTPAQQKALTEYLLSDPTMEEIPAEVLELDRKRQNHLALGKEMIANLFPHTLRKNCDEHFGLSHTRNSFQAIPYLRSNTPSEGSEFSSPFETMLYTTYYYARKGVSVDQIKKWMQECKEEALQEQKAYQTPLRETAAFRRFEALHLVPGRDLFSLQESEIGEVVAALNQDMRKKIAFSRAFGWREIGCYSKRLSCSAHHLAGAFSRVLGFTGTLWNGGSFPHGLNPTPQLATDGKTLALLKSAEPRLERCRGVSDLYASLSNYHACIDTGAWFRGIAGKEVALNMLAHLPRTIKAVVYLNDIDIPPGTKGQAVVIERGRERDPPKLLSSVTMPEKERFTYYNVTTGADIPQHAFATAVLTVGKNMMLRDLLQGAWRMRGLDKKQKVDFALPTALPIESFEGIVELCMRNQATRQSSDNLGSLKKQIAYVAEELVLKALRDPHLPIEEAIALSRAAGDILSPTLSMEPFELFGGVEREIPVETLIEEMISAQLKTLQELYRACPYLAQYGSFAEVERAMKERVDLTILPSHERRKNREEYGASTEMRQQTETAQQTQVQTELQLEVVQESASKMNPGHRPPLLPAANIWRNSYWSHVVLSRSVNDFLILRANELTRFRPERRVFSEHLHLTRGVAPEASESRGSILFQRGTMPTTTCALKIFPDGHKEMVFLDPNEAEFISLLLHYQKQYKEEKAEINPLIMTQKQFLFDRIMRDVKEHFEGRDLKEVAQKRGQLFDERELWDHFLSDSQAITMLRSSLVRSLGFQLREFSEEQVCKSANIPYYWRENFPYGAITMVFEGKEEFKLLLVDPKVGILQQGEPKIDPKALLNDPEYAMLTAQAKFYNGDLDSYSPLEREMLTRWMREQGREQMLSLLSNILRARPEDAARYPHSVLHTVFQNLPPPAPDEEKA